MRFQLLLMLCVFELLEWNLEDSSTIQGREAKVVCCISLLVLFWTTYDFCTFLFFPNHGFAVPLSQAQD